MKKCNLSTRQRQQYYVHALRMTMGLPLRQPTNDAVMYRLGDPLDLTLGAELARVVQDLQKDTISVSFATGNANRPSDISIVYLELDHVDVVSGLEVYAASPGQPVMLINTRAHEHFAVDRRGSLARIPGKPTDLVSGKKRAVKMIREAASRLMASANVDCQMVDAQSAIRISQAMRQPPIICFG